MPDCIFCRIAAGEIPAQVVRRTEHELAFRDLHPQAPVHVLVIPVCHHAAARDATGPEGERTLGRLLAFTTQVATELGLIVNELVSNAVKHACRNGKGGKIRLSLRQQSEDLVLRVRDNGPGLPADFDLARDSHVGLDVVRTLAERDLNGCFNLTDEGGVLAEVRFVW